MKDSEHAPPDPDLTLRAAAAADRPALLRLHHHALRQLGRAHYSTAQIDALLAHVPTLDDTLLDDGSYWVVESGDRLVGCGGWSARMPRYRRAVGLATDATPPAGALVRAMYTHPQWARRGIGRRILAVAEADARERGHRELALDALLPGVPLYRACGWQAVQRCMARLPGGATLELVRMRKSLPVPPIQTGDTPPAR